MKTPLSILFVFLFAGHSLAQSAGKKTTSSSSVGEMQWLDAKYDVRFRELEVALAETQEEAAATQVELAELQLKKASQDKGASGPAGVAVKRARLEMRMHHIRADIARVGLEKAMARIELLEKHEKKRLAKLGAQKKYAQAESAKKAIASSKMKAAKESFDPVPVKIEYDPEINVVIVRGPKDAVDRVQALIKKVAERSKQGD